MVLWPSLQCELLRAVHLRLAYDKRMSGMHEPGRALRLMMLLMIMVIGRSGLALTNKPLWSRSCAGPVGAGVRRDIPY